MDGGGNFPADRHVKIKQEEEAPMIAAHKQPRAVSTTGGSLAHPERYLLRTSSSALQKLKNLNPNGLLVLFTPAVAPLSREGIRMDPFEPLGRGLSTKHSRVRHVPYVPSAGFTNTHLQFLERADAIMVVMCASGGTVKTEPGLRSPSLLSVSTLLQLQFTGAVQQALHEARRNIPTVLILAGPGLSTEMRDAPDHTNQYHITIAVESYESSRLAEVPDILFAGK